MISTENGTPTDTPKRKFDEEFTHNLRSQILTLVAVNSVSGKFTETMSAVLEAAAITMGGFAATDRVLHGEKAGRKALDEGLAAFSEAVEQAYATSRDMPLPAGLTKDIARTISSEKED